MNPLIAPLVALSLLAGETCAQASSEIRITQCRLSALNQGRSRKLHGHGTC